MVVESLCSWEVSMVNSRTTASCILRWVRAGVPLSGEPQWLTRQRNTGSHPAQYAARSGPRVHHRNFPAAQRLDHHHGEWELSRRRRPEPGRAADPGDPSWPQQGPPTGPEAAAVSYTHLTLPTILRV